MQAHDIAKVRTLAIGKEEMFELTQATFKWMDAMHQYNDAFFNQFSRPSVYQTLEGDMQLKFSKLSLVGARADVRGNVAKISGTNLGGPHVGTTLILVDGTWKVDLNASAPPNADADTASIEKTATILSYLARQISSGAYPSEHDMEKAIDCEACMEEALQVDQPLTPPPSENPIFGMWEGEASAKFHSPSVSYGANTSSRTDWLAADKSIKSDHSAIPVPTAYKVITAHQVQIFSYPNNNTQSKPVLNYTCYFRSLDEMTCPVGLLGNTAWRFHRVAKATQ